MNERKARRPGGYSFPFGVPLVVYPALMYGAHEGGGRWWGWFFHLAIIGLFAAFTHTALSHSSYMKIHVNRPELDRRTWILNWMVFFVVAPAAVWCVVFCNLTRLFRPR